VQPLFSARNVPFAILIVLALVSFVSRVWLLALPLFTPGGP
jgi:hypothetical protein